MMWRGGMLKARPWWLHPILLFVSSVFIDLWDVCHGNNTQQVNWWWSCRPVHFLVHPWWRRPRLRGEGAPWWGGFSISAPSPLAFPVPCISKQWAPAWLALPSLGCVTGLLHCLITQIGLWDHASPGCRYQERLGALSVLMKRPCLTFCLMIFAREHDHAV